MVKDCGESLWAPLAEACLVPKSLLYEWHQKVTKKAALSLRVRTWMFHSLVGVGKYQCEAECTGYMIIGTARQAAGMGMGMTLSALNLYLSSAPRRQYANIRWL